MKLIDLTGQEFGRLTVVSRADSDCLGNSRWNCNCCCGEKTVVLGSSLKGGKTTSCGCLKKESVLTQNLTHGRPDGYGSWRGIKARCFNKNCKDYKYYGGRGITMYEPWINDFAAFYKHIGAKPSNKHTVDRIDNNGNYEPGNVRWATMATQNRNKRTQAQTIIKDIK